MSYSGDAAEQVVRMTLEGTEVAAKITGAGAKQLALLLYAVLRDQKKTKGKIRLTNMLRSGKELKVFAIQDGDLQRFCSEAKKYGVLYCVLKDKSATDGITDIMRQLAFSFLAIGVAILLYFTLKPVVGTETVSWMCILGAAPFAAMGFINYHGMRLKRQPKQLRLW